MGDDLSTTDTASIDVPKLEIDNLDMPDQSNSGLLRFIHDSDVRKLLRSLRGAARSRCRRRRPSQVEEDAQNLTKRLPEINVEGPVPAEEKNGVFSLVEQMGSLPEHIQAHLFGFSRVEGMALLATSCTELHQAIWEDAEIWHAMVIDEQPNEHVLVPQQKGARALRDDFRWRRYGIDAFCGWRKRPPSAQHAAAVKAAHRAIQGVLPSDGPRRIDSIASAMTDLLRWYDATDDAAHENARALVKAAAARKEVFSAEHIRELRRALEDSKVLRESLSTVRCTMTMDGSAPFGVLFGPSDGGSSQFFPDDSDGDCSPASGSSAFFDSGSSRPRSKLGSTTSSGLVSCNSSPEVPFAVLDDDDAAMDRVLNALRDPR